MSSIEHRVDTRLNVRVPLRFRLLNNSASTEETAESENISSRGIYFMTAFPLSVGMPVEVSIRMPQELAGKKSSEVTCLARVVRVHANSLVGGKTRIGLHIEQYEQKVSLSDRWAS